MTDEIRVSVVEFGDRRYYQMQYRDPTTDRKRTKSTGIERTGRKKERTEAEKVAGEFEAALREGRYQAPVKMTWDDFRERHEAEVQPSLAAETCKKFDTTFDLVERIIRPARLREVTTEAISRWVAELQKGRADTTVGIYCRHLRAALNWAKDMGFIPEAPKIRIPKGAKEGKMKSRPITGEEYERMTMAVPKVVSSPYVALWQHFLEGLWWSGLRLSEALRLSWEPTEAVSVVMQPGYHPVLQFRPEGQKARRAELVPCAPEFAEMLEKVPENQRTGRVFILRRSQRTQAVLSEDRVGRVTSDIGKAAHVIVDEETSKPATAHDYRRAFGTRWAKRVMPAVLKRLMRHKDIHTTLKYYVDQEAEDIAEDLWKAYRESAGNTLGNSDPKKAVFSGEK